MPTTMSVIPLATSPPHGVSMRNMKRKKIHHDIGVGPSIVDSKDSDDEEDWNIGVKKSNISYDQHVYRVAK